MNASENIKAAELLSWIDVARRLSYVSSSSDDRPPAGVIASSAYWSGLTLRIAPSADESAVIAWLARVFGSWLVVSPGKQPTIRLDAPAGMKELPVILVRLDAEPDGMPVFKPHAALEAERYFRTRFPLRPAQPEPGVFAFHSVKGGVGRTTSALAFALEKQPDGEGPVLIVDADFEAPGISFLLRSRKANSTISFEDLLALAHADRTDNFSAALDFVAERMVDQRVDGAYVLPAKRLLEDLSGFAVRPENMLTAQRDNPYVVVDLVRALAKRLGCRRAVVDLRAGLVDVAVQFLTDPSVERVFVTTAGGQSIAALQSMIRTLGLMEAHTGVPGRQPLVIFNQMPIYRLSDAEFRGQLVNAVLAAAEASFQPQGEVGASPIQFAFLPHLSDLIATAGDWDDFQRDLSASSFAKSLSSEMRNWSGLDGLIPSNAQVAGSQSVGADHDARCRSLQEYAEKLEVAETAKDIARPLATPPLQRLASDFLSQPPIVVVEGAKGTGKTLTARYLLQHGSWKEAVANLDSKLLASFEGMFLPLFGSVASNEAMLNLIKSGREFLSERLESDRLPFTLTETEQSIKVKLTEDASQSTSSWLDFWLQQIAASSGFHGDGAWARFMESARASDIKPIVVVEGLEEILTDPFSNNAQAEALLSLLREVPLRLREEAGRPVGYLAFVRADMVEATMLQNLAQFRAGYANYALDWLESDIRELVIWLVGHSGAIPGIWGPEWRNQNLEKQDADLRKVWGLKLGNDDSREARSSEWVISVLTDLTGRLTARDLVRFIGAAAKSSRGQPATDRLLSAGALKSAVERTSKMKVEEYPKEVRQLGPIFEKLKKHSGFETPFARSAASAIGVSDTELDSLEKYGVAYQEDGVFEVPELFRIGLDMRRSGARPNIISLTRRARERARS